MDLLLGGEIEVDFYVIDYDRYPISTWFVSSREDTIWGYFVLHMAEDGCRPVVLALRKQE